MSEKPYLSLVAASRNDGHGGDLLQRMQYWIDGVTEQALRYKVPLELIIVEWNPLPDQPLLFEVLDLKPSPYLTFQFIEVPNSIHAGIAHADQIPFYQMWAKNVGIRRARGEFVLATCIDLFYDNAFMQYLKKRPFRNGRFYRMARCDVGQTDIPGRNIDEKLSFCKKHTFHIGDGIASYAHGVPLHTDACGDFTLMSKSDWFRLRGYPELPMYSYHIDSLFLHMAVKAGFKEDFLKYRCYHIKHALSATHMGSGENKRVEGYRKVFTHVFSGGDLIRMSRELMEGKRPFEENDDDWGLGRTELAEYEIGVTDKGDLSVSTADVTIYAVPKAFTGIYGTIQSNAIASWTRLNPRPRIVLVGDEEGVAAFAKRVSVEHVPDVAKNDRGTPLLNSVFDIIHRTSKTRAVAYVNSDIVLFNDFMNATEMASESFDQFLMIGRRTNFDVKKKLGFRSGWEKKLRHEVHHSGRLFTHGAIDYFVFRWGVFRGSVPQFAVGRTAWDNWLVGAAWGKPVIDATSSVLAIHQNHGYGADGKGPKKLSFGGEEAKLNRRLGKHKRLHSVHHATYVFRSGRIYAKGGGLPVVAKAVLTQARIARTRDERRGQKKRVPIPVVKARAARAAKAIKVTKVAKPQKVRMPPQPVVNPKVAMARAETAKMRRGYSRSKQKPKAKSRQKARKRK